MAVSSLESPRITFLRAELKNGRQAAREAFWREIEEKGALLIEEAEEVSL